MKYVLSYFLPFLYFVVNAQNQKDSLHNELTSADSNHEKTTVLLELAKYYLSVNLDSAEHYTKRAVSLVDKENDFVQTLLVDRFSAVIAREKGRLDSAIAILNISIENISKEETKRKLDQKNEVSTKALIFKDIAANYFYKGDYEQAVKNNLIALKTFDSLLLVYPDDQTLQKSSCSSIMAMGAFHDVQKQIPLSMKYFKKALEKQLKYGLTESATFTTANIGASYTNREIYDTAIIYLTDALTLIDSLKIERLRGSVLRNLSDCYLSTKNYQKATVFVNDLMKLSQQQNNEALLANTYSFMSIYQSELGYYDSAIMYAEKGLELKSEDINTKLSLYNHISHAYEMKGLYQKALMWYQELDNIEDSIFNEQSNRNLATIEAKYQNEKKENEIQQQQAEITLLEKDNRINGLTNNLLILGIVVLLTTGFFGYKYYAIRENRKREMLEASLELEKVQKENAELKSVELEKELHSKSQQLTSYTLNFVQKNELLKELKELVEEINGSGNGNVKTNLNKLRRTIDHHNSIDQDWEDFKTQFEGVHKNFFTELKQTYPDLTSNDLKVCALTRLNLNLKESSTILGISHESVKMARYRIKKRMELNKEDTLMNHLMAFG